MRIARISVYILLVLAAAGCLVQAADAATPVYYSVGQNTIDLKSGAPAVTIVSGVATFSVPQTSSNMGVGDRVTYNGSTIAYVSQKISFSQWRLVTAIGADAPNVTGLTVNSIRHEFASLAAAVSGAADANHLNTSNLVSGDYALNIPCYYSTVADSTSVTIGSYTTGASNGIRIYAPSNISTEVNQSQRHHGKWDNGKYKLHVTSLSTSVYTLGINIPWVWIDGLQIEATSTASSYNGLVGIYVNPGLGVFEGPTQISNCIIRQTAQGGIPQYANGIYADGSYGQGSTTKIWNTIVYDWNGSVLGRGIGNGYGDMIVYNSLAYGCIQGFDSVGGTMRIINNISQGNTFAYQGTYVFADYNISDQANTPGINSKSSVSVSFISAAGRDFHLLSTDTVARGAGFDLSADADIPFNTDIDGQTRVAPWDIGPDQYSAAGTTLSNIPYTIGSGGQIRILP